MDCSLFFSMFLIFNFIILFLLNSRKSLVNIENNLICLFSKKFLNLFKLKIMLGAIFWLFLNILKIKDLFHGHKPIFLYCEKPQYLSDTKIK